MPPLRAVPSVDGEGRGGVGHTGVRGVGAAVALGVLQELEFHLRNRAIGLARLRGHLLLVLLQVGHGLSRINGSQRICGCPQENLIWLKVSKG